MRKAKAVVDPVERGRRVGMAEKKRGKERVRREEKGKEGRKGRREEFTALVNYNTGCRSILLPLMANVMS